jgi:hypothetical protein
MAPRSFGSAMPPPPDAATAQSGPAAANKAAMTGVPAPKPAVAAAKPGALPASALSAPRNDPHWRDVDPAELADADNAAKAKDPALEKFHDDQQRRDQQLMAQDAEEAARHADRGDDRYRDDDRYARSDERYSPRADERYDDDGYGGDRYAGDDRYADQDPRYAARRASRERERAQAYGDDRYGRGEERNYAQDPYPNEYPPDGDGYDDGGYEQGPPPDDYYDPYQR